MPDVLTARWTAQLNTKTECVPPPRDSPPTRKTPHRKYSSTSLSAADRIQKKNPPRKKPESQPHTSAGRWEEWGPSVHRRVESSNSVTRGASGTRNVRWGAKDFSCGSWCRRRPDERVGAGSRSGTVAIGASRQPSPPTASFATRRARPYCEPGTWSVLHESNRHTPVCRLTLDQRGVNEHWGHVPSPDRGQP